MARPVTLHRMHSSLRVVQLLTGTMEEASNNTTAMLKKKAGYCTYELALLLIYLTSGERGDHWSPRSQQCFDEVRKSVQRAAERLKRAGGKAVNLTKPHCQHMEGTHGRDILGRADN